MNVQRICILALLLSASCGRGGEDRERAQKSASPAATAVSDANPSATPIAFAPSTAQTAAEIIHAKPTVFRVGRFDDSNSRGPIFAWSGSTISARFHGSEARVKLKDDAGHNFFRARIDGGSPFVFETKSGEKKYDLAKDLDIGDHEIEIVKRTEARSGEVQFLGFDFGEGEMLAPRAHKSRRIEILGDSIATGYGIEGSDANTSCNDIPRVTDETQTAGALVANDLGAEHITIAWSAKTIREVTELWDRTLPGNDKSHWDYSFVPAAVVVNLGTNDFYTGDPGLSSFEKRYDALLEKIRAKYKDVFVLAVLGPMTSDVYPEGKHHYTLARSYLAQVVESAKKRGDTHFELLDFGPADPKDGWGCRFHPGPITQRKMADAIAAVLREHLSWNSAL